MADISSPSVSQATRNCLESFQIYKEEAKTRAFPPSDFAYHDENCPTKQQEDGATRFIPSEWADNRIADFNLWASSIGALAAKRASLDARLETQPDLLTFVINLVKLLDLLIQDCIELGRQIVHHSSI